MTPREAHHHHHAPPAEIRGRVATKGGSLRVLTIGLAVLGGLILVGVTIMVVVSVIGRAALNAPVSGDVEIVGILTGVAVLLFFPYTQMSRSHITVDILVERISDRPRARLEAFHDLLFAIVAAMLTWRLVVGGIEKYHSGEISMILAIPAWWVYPVGAVAMALLTIVCVANIWIKLQEASR